MDNKRFFTIEDNQSLIYFQLPKVLMVGEKYKSLSNDAKLLYSYYLDLNLKSMKYGWKDDEGRYYIKFKDKNAMEFIGCATQKLSNLKKELDKYDLIHVVRTGQGKTNITYVLKLDYTDEDVYKVNEEFDNVAEDAEKSDHKADLRKSKVSTESNDLRKSKDKNFENQSSRSLKIKGQDFRKSKFRENAESLDTTGSKGDFSDSIENYSSDIEPNENYNSENYSSSSISPSVDNSESTEYGNEKTEEEDKIVKRKLRYLGEQLAENNIMRTNKQIDKVINLVVERGLLDFSISDVSTAIAHYQKECIDRSISYPATYFVNGFEMKLDEKYSFGIGEEGRQEREERQRLQEERRKRFGDSLPIYNWLDE